MKPETALTRIDWPFFVPDWSKEIVAEVSLAARINHLGKSIPERFAHRYFDQVTIGVNFRARDIYNELISAHNPTDIATGFDGSCYLGEWLSLSDLPSDWLSSNYLSSNLLIESGPSSSNRLSSNLLIESNPLIESGLLIDNLISEASRYYLLKTGDIVMTAPLALIENVKEGDIISASLAGNVITHCRCK